jgi:hypothetical protein
VKTFYASLENPVKTGIKTASEMYEQDKKNIKENALKWL